MTLARLHFGGLAAQRTLSTMAASAIPGGKAPEVRRTPLAFRTPAPARSGAGMTHARLLFGDPASQRTLGMMAASAIPGGKAPEATAPASLSALQPPPGAGPV